MKKALFLAVLLFVTICVFAQDTHDNAQEDMHGTGQENAQENQDLNTSAVSASSLRLNFAKLGMGMYLLFDTSHHIMDLSIDLMEIGIENNKTGFGVTLSPFSFFTMFGGDNNLKTCFSFLNLAVHWNFLGLLGVNDDSFFMSPFLKVNYLILSEEMEWDRFAFSAGMQGGLGGVRGKMKYNILIIETGFRMIDLIPKFYIGVKYDPMMHWLNQRGTY